MPLPAIVCMVKSTLVRLAYLSAVAFHRYKGRNAERSGWQLRLAKPPSNLTHSAWQFCNLLQVSLSVLGPHHTLTAASIYFHTISIEMTTTKCENGTIPEGSLLPLALKIEHWSLLRDHHLQESKQYGTRSSLGKQSQSESRRASAYGAYYQEQFNTARSGQDEKSK